MDYLKFTFGISFLILSFWLLLKTRKESGQGWFRYFIGRYDIFICLIAGVYLIVTSSQSLFF